MTSQAVNMREIEPSGPPMRVTQGGIVRRYPQLTISPAILAALLAGW